ncbi:uncharacterized protein LOC135202311 isoform X2 [Macrobrachium nipponense]|uniref:uncharacterized protein LOC135202311 isoform X2 n=1 Tax=Macrobrachium nipponense TaxID=159736 RepID=UPI0030C87E49
MAKYRKVPENYFKFVNPIIVSLIGVGMYLLLMAWLDPRNISTTYFGRVAEFATWLGTENNHLMKQIFLVTLAVHISETMLAVFLCYKRRIGSLATIAWTIQTLVCGIFSLYFLMWPSKSPKPAKKREQPNKSKKSKEQKNSKQANAQKSKKSTAKKEK